MMLVCYRQQKYDFFCYLCPVVLSRDGATVFIEKKASFRLSGRVNLDNLLSLHGYRKSSLPIMCLIAKIGGACSSVSCKRESRPYSVDAVE